MQLYLDTGNVEEIRQVALTGMLSGVTTNPTLIAREGREFKEVVKEIAKILGQFTDDFTVSAEVNSTSWEDMVKEGRQYSKWHKNVIIKVPLTENGLKACRALSSKKIRVNVTLCFSANQALLAAKAGAFVVSPFVGRVDDHGGSGMELIQEIRQVFDNYGFTTKILVASVRHPGHVKEAALIGADIATIPYKVFKRLYYHPLTDAGIISFNEDYQKYKVAMEKQHASR